MYPQDDRIQWMEAILPGSSKNIRNPIKKTDSGSFTTNTPSPPPPRYSNPLKKTDSGSFTTSTPSPPPPPRYSPPITQPHNKTTASPLPPLATPNPYVTLVPHPQQSIQHLPYPEQPVSMPRPQVSPRRQFTQSMGPQVSRRQQFTQSMGPQVSPRQQFTESMGPQVSQQQQFTESMGPQVSQRQQFTESMGPQVSPRQQFTESFCPQVSPQLQFTGSIGPQVCLVNQHSGLPYPQHSTMPYPQNDPLSPTDDLLSPGPIPPPRDRKESDARHYIQPSSLNMPNKKLSRAHSNSIQKHHPRQVKTQSQEESVDSQEGKKCLSFDCYCLLIDSCCLLF